MRQMSAVVLARRHIYVLMALLMLGFVPAACVYKDAPGARQLNCQGQLALGSGKDSLAGDFFKAAVERSCQPGAGTDAGAGAGADGDAGAGDCLSQALDNLGRLYRRQARLADLESFLSEQIDQTSLSLGASSPQVFALSEKLSDCYLWQGKLAQAEATGRQALSAGQSVFGYNSPRLIPVLNNIIAAACPSGRCQDLESEWQHLLDIRLRSYGKDHPDTVMTSCQIAELYEKKGRLADAASLLKKALDIRQAQKSPLTGATLIQLVRLKEKEGKWQEAKVYLQEAIEFERTRKPADVTFLPAALNEMYKLEQCQRKLRAGKPPKVGDIR